jgi:hypothetical protein
MKTCVIAGMDTVDNPFSRFVSKYWFKPIHIPSYQENLPKADCAILVTTNIGHDLMHKVKESNYPHVFFGQQGSASIATDFYRTMLEPIEEKIKEKSQSDAYRYLLCEFFDKNDVVDVGKWDAMYQTLMKKETRLKFAGKLLYQMRQQGYFSGNSRTAKKLTVIA